MKKIARNLVAAVLGWQVRRLYGKGNFKVVAVAGSVGKTSTKLAIAQVLSAGLRVRYQQGNYNDLVTVPLIFFDTPEPSLFNPFAWLRVFLTNEMQLHKKYPYDVVVVEVGTDFPGRIAEFKRYLKAEIAVLTGVAPEHMEYFDDLDAVTREETTIAEMATLTLVNTDLYDGELGDSWLSYAINRPADFKLDNVSFNEQGSSFDVMAAGKKIFSAQHKAISEPELYSILAAVAVAYKLGLDNSTIKNGFAAVKPFAGRMSQLAGINKTRIIDDTYNASPEAMKAALSTLYRLSAPQKIALLGNMNELGKYSEAAHREIGKLCDPQQIDVLVTLGPDANKFLAEEARQRGCEVHEFSDPYSAGEYIKSSAKTGALILAKGSQNKVFAEEAVKLLLANPADQSKLVRQSSQWLKIKKDNFA